MEQDKEFNKDTEVEQDQVMETAKKSIRKKSMMMCALSATGPPARQEK